MRRKKGRRQNEDLGEPEILPMMNVLFMLVMVLMGMSAFLPLGVITTQAPRLASAGAAVSSKAQGLNLRIMLLKSGINVSVNGSLLKGATNPLFPKIKFGEHLVYDFTSLTQRLTELKAQNPNENSVMIMADPNVTYENIVHAMDASRESVDGKLLFPDVAFIPGLIN